jgi:CTP:molybdopterin cytidylyltransferase MocA
VTVAAILLAAGESRRMGRPKPLLEWGGTTLIEYQIGQLREAGVDDVIAVLGHGAESVRSHAERAGARVVVNARHAAGRASSLRAGAAAVGDDAEAVVVLSVDQPRPAAVAARLLGEMGNGKWVVSVPVFDGRRGHPVVLDGSLLPELRTVTEEALGLRGLLTAHASGVREVPFGSAVVLVDMNDPEEYERAIAAFAADT